MEVKQIQKLYEAMEANGYESLELELGKKNKIKLKLDQANFLEPETLYEEFEEEEDSISKTQIEIRSDKVGTFSFARENLEIGDQIKKGEVLGTVKGISFLDKIKCSVDGRISNIAIQQGGVVDYGRLLFVVEID